MPPSSGAAYDAVVVGAGPNGLSAAVEIARAGRSVLVLEGAEDIGGGTRTSELTLAGFHHDVCSAIHPLGVASPFFSTLPLSEHGLDWVHPDVALAHPLDDGTAVVLYRSVDDTADGLGDDAAAYRRLMRPLMRNGRKLINGFLTPLLRPRNPLIMARFGATAIRSADRLLRARFKGERARAILAGNAAHALMPLDRPLTGGFSLIYNILGHEYGWPMARGGSRAIADALAAHLRSMGGRIETGRPVRTFADIPTSRVVLFDLDPRQVAAIAADRLPARYRRKLERFRYGPGVFKIDWALDAPIPWKAGDAARAGTLHLGGTLEEIAASEQQVADGTHPQRPWVIVAQQTLFDQTRAPAGKHTAWAYTHVPNGSTVDMTSTVEDQVERFAPGFRDVVIGRATKTAAELGTYNPNYVGGDIGSGAADLRQIIGRPVISLVPHATPNKSIYLCSSSSAPGPGVHGMCGYYAARAALKRLR